MIVTVTYTVLGDTATAVHEAVRVTFRAGRGRGATVREYDEHNTELRSTWYRSAWIITRTKEETTWD